ncbi:hypothetical protein SDC9_120290 [bioreactor metagenome]|uniref:Uncharacterized protein n=1 Tax=bioreactor metagenome TaxID=1076179 RepID=A0A645C6C9_9ZZZZ
MEPNRLCGASCFGVVFSAICCANITMVDVIFLFSKCLNFNSETRTYNLPRFIAIASLNFKIEEFLSEKLLKKLPETQFSQQEMRAFQQ